MLTLVGFRVLRAGCIGNLFHDRFGLEVTVGTRSDLDVVSVENLGYGGRVAGEVALGALRDATTAPGDEDILRKSRVGVLDLDEGELDAALVEILDQVGQLAVCVRGVSTRTIMSAAGTNEQLRTACALDLEDTLLGGAILESADERCLNGEERPLSVRGRARCWRLAVDDAGVAALYGRPIDGKVQRRHGKWRGEVGSVPDVVTASAAVEWGRGGVVCLLPVSCASWNQHWSQLAYGS
ncbi:hypothetical protein ACCO45_003179 [Purpureocillium lilacinum]|uniref:Uncharacterized protein n=1 Tax=Purpureocillium lilacinum TaxID=33203 RepID=A0ACC4DZH4_PURLI